MTATEWKNKGQAAAQAEAVPLELPSGMTILARRPSPLQVAMWGQLPLRLAAAVMGESSPETPSREDLIAGVKLSRDLLAYCCVQPRISLEPQGEFEIHPRDIEMSDVLFILRWAHRGEEADNLRTFRGESPDAGAGEDGAEIRTETVVDARHTGRGAGSRIRPGGVHGANVSRT